MTTKSWRSSVFKVTQIACGQFVVVTFLAMLLYAGGTAADNSAPRYQFFNNFFSDLGLTIAHSGESNTISAILFFLTLTFAGLGVVAFFVAAPYLFGTTAVGKWLARFGSVFGIITGLSYVGVAFTPANLFLDAHRNFVLAAFSAFLVVVIAYVIAIFVTQSYPNVYAFVYMAFAVLLAIYLWLIFNGPGFETARGITIQATGQKIIVYAAIICMFIQSIGANRQIHHS